MLWCESKVIYFRALCDIFQKLHGDFSSRSMLWKSNTSLVLTNTCKFGFEYEPFPRISLTFIVIDRESKYMRQLYAMINKDAPDPDTPRVVKSIQIQAWLGTSGSSTYSPKLTHQAASCSASVAGSPGILWWVNMETK